MKRQSDNVEVLRRDLKSIQETLRTHKNHARKIEGATRLLAHAVQRLAVAEKERQV